jgi:hypothetical protein
LEAQSLILLRGHVLEGEAHLLILGLDNPHCVLLGALERPTVNLVKGFVV